MKQLLAGRIATNATSTENRAIRFAQKILSQDVIQVRENVGIDGDEEIRRALVSGQ